ncbi:MULTISPECIES: histidine phosphatase family protein [Pseudomonas]|uniref:Histidine phosphatase family protein n=1 Tax=Pseudomonas mosselii TaxID=78327 RepID=A0A5R8ZFY3_9PSED|nr:histidine phosphatase family protein [Pseudomonas mosselii]TLP64670.1 histidine phosphatase family protein [Pseudomonas mosselii]
MGNLYLIRHGQASFGADDYDVLSDVGERQSVALGEYLGRLGLRLDRCVAGTLRRQQDTARLTLQAMGQQAEAPAIETDAAFNEFDADGVIRALLPALLPDEPEALHVLRNGAAHRCEFQRLFALMVQRWLTAEHAEDPQLETWQAFTGRVSAGLQRLLDSAASGDDIAVFTSGGTIATLLHLTTGITPVQAFALNWQIINTSLSQLKFRGCDVALASFNSQAHVQLLRAPELITYR